MVARIIRFSALLVWTSILLYALCTKDKNILTVFVVSATGIFLIICLVCLLWDLSKTKNNKKQANGIPIFKNPPKPPKKKL